MKLLIFAASHRPESYNRLLAQLAAAHVQADADFAEYREFDMPLYDDTLTPHAIPDAAHRLARRAASAHGLIIAAPEYNWSYPGSLKTIIDWTSRLPEHSLAGKTALLLSATTGERGGILGLAHLKTPLEAVGMFVYPRFFPLGRAATAFDESGALRDEQQRALFIALLKDYTAFTRALMPAH